MASTPPPRPISPVVVVPKSGYALQISPNLEALLEHDELTRRTSNSPTSAHHTVTSPALSISLLPPPPRKAQSGRKTGQREQEPPLPTTRSKEGLRRKALTSDFWPDALPTTLPPDTSVAGQSVSTTPSSRPVTPNPYLNPAPILEPRSHHPDIDGAQSPKQAEKSVQNGHRSESSRSAAEMRGRSSPSDSSCRPSTALNKVEKILWMGRDSLSLFSGSGPKRNDSDRRHDRAEWGDSDAVQGNPIFATRTWSPVEAATADRQMRQVSVPPTQNVSDSRPVSRLCDSDTATSSSRPSSPYLHALHQRSSDSASTRSSSIYSEPRPANHPTPQPAPRLLPRLSLPSMSYDPPRPQSADSITGHDYLSFIDFFSPSTSDELNIYSIQDKSRRQPQPISIPPSSLYAASCYNPSSTSLASMKFAPPSPTSLPVQQPYPVCSPSDSSPSVAFSSMVFATPPSPSAEHVASTWLQPLSDPPSPYSPLEFAPPPSSPQEIFDGPSLPTAPELTSERGRKLKSAKRSISLSPHPVHHHLLLPLPPTTNQLDATERADRIRRNRKLARVFGRMPGTDEAATDADEPCVSKKPRSPSLATLLTKPKIHRHAVSVSVSLKSHGMKTEPSTPWQTDSPDGRRHSTPLATGSFTLYVDNQRDVKAAKDPRRRHNIMDSPETASSRSFIDLSDEEAREDDDVSGLNFLAPCPQKYRRLHQSTSTPSLFESLDSEAQAEADRRRKREKVAKLHRFLGSRVPPEAIIGSVFGPPLPPAATTEESSSEHRLRGHKNEPSDDFDRVKEELDGKEKALNVRRAQKMERVFGIPPPQMLFHTRPSRPTAPISQPTSPANIHPYVLTLDFPSSSRNPNQSAYMRKTLHRRGPSDSSRCLLPHMEDTPQLSPSSFAQSFTESFTESLSGYQEALARSSVYLNYQHSLNSLVDIIDRDDRKSLVELHRLLQGGDASPLEEEVTVDPRHVSMTASLKSERRHSLPSKASTTSLSSEFHASPELSQFQIRRRKAAKLTNFFGVDYRELIHDILESVEKGVEEERKQGTLQPQEVEVLMHRVRSLRTIQDPFL